MSVSAAQDAGDAGTARALPLLGCAGFGSMFAMRMCDAMLPELERSFHASASATAGAVSAFAVSYGVMQLVAGPLGDRFGKPQIISLAALLCGLAGLATAVAPSLAALTLGRVCMGAAASGVIPLTMAWIGDSVPWQRRQEVLAQLLSYTVVGMMAGAWAGGALSEVVSWRWAFAGVGALLIAAAVAIYIGLCRRAPQLTPIRTRYRAQVKQILGDAAARRLFTVTLIEGGLVFGALAFVPSALHQRFGLSLSTAGGVLALFGVGGLVYSRVAGLLLRRTSRSRLTVAGGGLLCIAFVGMAVMRQWWWGVPACMVAGVGFYMFHSTLQACATQLSTVARGTAVSLFACALFLGQSAGVSAMAQGWVHGQLDLLTAGAGVALLLLAIFFAVRLREPA